MAKRRETDAALGTESGWFIGAPARDFAQIGRTSEDDGMICLKIPIKVFEAMLQWFRGSKFDTYASFGKSMRIKDPGWHTKEWNIFSRKERVEISHVTKEASTAYLFIPREHFVELVDWYMGKLSQDVAA